MKVLIQREGISSVPTTLSFVFILQLFSRTCDNCNNLLYLQLPKTINHAIILLSAFACDSYKILEKGSDINQRQSTTFSSHKVLPSTLTLNCAAPFNCKTQGPRASLAYSFTASCLWWFRRCLPYHFWVA